MGFFPFAEDSNARGSRGSLIKNETFYKPSADGVLIYFSSSEITNELNKVESAGGGILQDKTLINDEIGYMALFKDSEGNRIALHSKE